MCILTAWRGGARVRDWSVACPDTAEFRDVDHKLQVASEVVALSLLGLEVIGYVCVSGSSIQCL